MYPPIDRPYFVTDDIAVPASPGLEPVKFDIALRRATWASGKVTDIRTGKPVANALIDYFPMLSNERAKDYPNFDPAITGSVAVKTHHRTDKEGRFRVAVLHGRGVVTVRARTRSVSYRVRRRGHPGAIGPRPAHDVRPHLPVDVPRLERGRYPGGVDLVLV